MSYIHSFCLNTDLTERALEEIKIVLDDFKEIIQLDKDNDESPVENLKEIRFNGIANSGYEQFVLRKGEKSTCRTDRRDYDIVVSSILLILIRHYKNELVLESDGLWGGNVDASWSQAIRYINENFRYMYEKEIEKVYKHGREYYKIKLVPTNELYISEEEKIIESSRRRKKRIDELFGKLEIGGTLPNSEVQELKKLVYHYIPSDYENSNEDDYWEGLSHQP